MLKLAIPVTDDFENSAEYVSCSLYEKDCISDSGKIHLKLFRRKAAATAKKGFVAQVVLPIGTLELFDGEGYLQQIPYSVNHTKNALRAYLIDIASSKKVKMIGLMGSIVLVDFASSVEE